MRFYHIKHIPIVSIIMFMAFGHKLDIAIKLLKGQLLNVYVGLFEVIVLDKTSLFINSFQRRKSCLYRCFTDKIFFFLLYFHRGYLFNKNLWNFLVSRLLTKTHIPRQAPHYCRHNQTFQLSQSVILPQLTYRSQTYNQLSEVYLLFFLEVLCHPLLHYDRPSLSIFLP